MGVESELLGVSSDKYGAEYKTHLLEQYKIYVEMADRISSRRQSANNFFLTINTTLITLLGLVRYLSGNTDSILHIWTIAVALVGIGISYLWYRSIRSYKDMNTGKFRVIHAIEKHLPLQIYSAEWISLGEGKDKKLYLPFTHIETKIPWLFIMLYAFIIFLALN